MTGEGIPPTGPWAIVIKGGNSFSQTVALVAGAQATVKVPGRYEPGSVGIGEFAGGYDYAISEPEPLGALASVDPTLVTVTNGQTHKVAVTNQYDPVPEPEPEPPVPPQPPIPPGPPQPLPGPDLVLAASLGGGADLAVSERISPRVSQVGHVVTVTVRVRNLGPLPADGAVVREIPQVDPRHPNQVAQILGVTPTIRATSPCTSTRPVRCGPATLAVGAEAVVRVRARMLRAGAFQSVVVASSLRPTPTPPTTRRSSAWSSRAVQGRGRRPRAGGRARRRARVVPRRCAGHGQRRRRVRALLPPPARAPAHDLGAGDVPLPRARMPRRVAPGCRGARRVHRARDTRLERRRAHAAAAGDGHGAGREAGRRGGPPSGDRPDLRRDRLEPGLAEGAALDGLRARRRQPPARGWWRGCGGGRRLAHEAFQRGHHGGGLLGRGGRGDDPQLRAAVGHRPASCHPVSAIPVLSHDAVLAAVSPEQAIARTRAAFVRHHAREWSMPPKVYLESPGHGDFRAMPARGDGLAMLKWISSFPGNPGTACRP